jgi:hypothetical protein
MNMFADMIIPPWARWLALLIAGAFIFMFGDMHGRRIEGEKHIAYVTAQAAQTVKIAKAQVQVVTRAEIEYRDRIQKVYLKGEVIEKEVPVYVTKTDDSHCIVNAGFVRSYDAAWSGEPAGPAEESDRGPSGIPLSVIAETDAFNAKACRAWREQALGWREFYGRLKAAVGNPDRGIASEPPPS